MNIRDIKKGQAALEFLTTYGWAFLVILIMIGTLAYFGILSPSKVLPSRCNFGTEFQCIDYQVSATNNQFLVKLKSNLGEPIAISAFTMTKEDGTAYSCTINAQNTTITTWPTSALKDLGATGCASTGWVSGEKAKVLITLTYNTLSSGSTYSKQVKGEVYATVV